MKMVCCWLLLIQLFFSVMAAINNTYEDKNKGFPHFVAILIVYTFITFVYYGAGIINGALTGE